MRIAPHASTELNMVGMSGFDPKRTLAADGFRLSVGANRYSLCLARAVTKAGYE